MPQTSVVNDLLGAIADTRIFGERRRNRRTSRVSVKELIDAILAQDRDVGASERGAEFLRVFRDLDSAGRTFVFRTLAADYGPDAQALAAAARAYLDTPTPAAGKALQRAAEPRRVELFRRLNDVTGGTEALVAMRLELFARLAHHPEFWVVDDDLKRLFRAWFNRGFLELRAVDWNTSAAVLEKIIKYEAVHAINGWEDLRRRIDVPDRRLFAFFHPRLGNEPLIFVEVALMEDVPSAIAPILSPTREPRDPQSATTAVFYSISNCQDGLRGISFGSTLIEKVAAQLQAELPNVKTLVTLSPVPGFGDWARAEAGDGAVPSEEARGLIETLSERPDWPDDPILAESASELLGPLAAHYLTVEKDGKGRIADPVARFHLGNGARLDRVHPSADLSARGLASSFGVMVNYRYVLADLEKNRDALAGGEVPASNGVQRLARAAPLIAPSTAQAGEEASARALQKSPA